MTDREGTIIFVNPEFTRVYGWTAEEVVGKQSPRVLKSGRVPAETYEGFWATLLSKQVVRGELINKTKDGRLLDIDGSANPVLDDDGEIVGFLAIQRDISAPKRVRERLSLTQFTVDHAPFGVLWLTSDGRIAYANDVCPEMVGYSQEQLLGLALWDLDESLDAVTWRSTWSELIERGTLARESTMLHEGGRAIPVDLVFRHLNFEGQAYACAFCRDISKHKRLSEQLQQAQKMEAVGQLAGGVAHDFNNILTAMSSYASLVREEFEVGDSRRSDMDDLLGLVRRAADLTHQLLAFSRKQVLHAAVVDLDDLIVETHKMLRRLIPENIELQVHPCDETCTVVADRGQMVQVVMNLAVNARDAMPAGGLLEIATGRTTLARRDGALGLEPGVYVQIRVRDTGAGMTPDVLARVFEPFFTTKARDLGTGLGLSTVYGIVKQSGGAIAATSAVGQGSEFTVYLPCAGRSDERPVQHDAPAEPLATGETVLLVEDDPEVRRVVELTLARHGYRVHTAGNAGEALLLLEQRSADVDLLVTDIVLPHVDGVELARRLRLTRPAVPVLLMTGYVDQPIDLGQLEPPARLLRKPFRAEQLLEHVRMALAG